ncbi:MAG TPA: hypothetical protein VL096_03965 [Pirellulaceae bacterium]|nr:hypothetical protein [Pirellulaceae bacterium]
MLAISNHRRGVLILAIIVGVLAMIGVVLYSFAGPGMFDWPFQGKESYYYTTLFFVLVCGPCSILPLTLLEIWKPCWGAIGLCSLAIVEVGLIGLNNLRQWGFAEHDAALGSLCLAAPMFLLGSLLLATDAKPHKRFANAWWWLMLIAVGIASRFLVLVGRDGFDIVVFTLKRLWPH